MKYFVHDHALVDPKAKIGVNTRIWAFVNIQAGALVGEDCNICDGSFVEKGAVVGNFVTDRKSVV